MTAPLTPERVAGMRHDFADVLDAGLAGTASIGGKLLESLIDAAEERDRLRRTVDACLRDINASRGEGEPRLGEGGLVINVAALIVDRDRLQAVLLSKHGGEPLALLAELDTARAELADLGRVHQHLADEESENDRLRAQRDGLLAAAERVTAWLADPQMGQWTYIEGGTFYDDIDSQRKDLDEAIRAAKETK